MSIIRFLNFTIFNYQESRKKALENLEVKLIICRKKFDLRASSKVLTSQVKISSHIDDEKKQLVVRRWSSIIIFRY